MSRLQPSSLKTIRYSFYTLFFLTPLMLTPWNFELFEFNKMMLIYFLTLIIIGSWALHSLSTKKFTLSRTPLDIPLLLFLGSQILSTIFSIHHRTSLIGYYSRFNGGLYSTIAYFILYYAFVTFMGKKSTASSPDQPTSLSSNPHNSLLASQFPPLRNCLALLLTSATIVSAYGIAEHFGIDSHLWIQDVQTRVFSTLGQPNWLAAFLIGVISLPLAFALQNKKPSLTHVATFAIFFTALIYTKSRSGVLAFAAIYFLFWLLTFIQPKLTSFKKSLWKPFIIFGSLILILSASDGLRWIPQINHLYLRFNPPRQTQATPTATSSATTQNPQPTPAPPPAGSQLEVGGSESSRIRRIVWRGALDVWRHWPIFGSGVETFAYSYYNFRPSEHNLVSEWDFLYNKAHNEYLNYLATTGAFGLASYLLLQTWFVVWILKKIFVRQKSKSTHSLLLIALLTSYIGMSISNFFGFSTVIISLFFFIFPAFAIVLTHDQTLKTLPFQISPLSQKILKPIILLITAYFLLQLSQWWYADSRFALGKKYADSNQTTQALPLLQQAVDLLPREPTFRAQLAQTYADLALLLAQNQITQTPENEDAPLWPEATQYAESSISELDQVQALNPVHLNLIKIRIRTLLTLAQLNPDLLSQARETIVTGLKLSPTDAKLMYNLALVDLQLGEADKAKAALEATIKMKPNYETARYALGLYFEESGQIDQAIEQYQYILTHIAPGNTKVQQKLQNLQ